MPSSKPWPTIKKPRSKTIYTRPFEYHHNVRTNTEDFTWQFSYRLKNNRIEIKQHSHTVLEPFTMYGGKKVRSTTTDWHVYENIGIPYTIKHNKKISLLYQNEKMIKIAVAGENIHITTNSGRKFLYKVTGDKYPQGWKHFVGQPLPGRFTAMRGSRCSTLSLGIGNLPEMRNIAVMHENDRVDYSEDAKGEKHEFGFTLTNYELSEDGATIRYWDTGLAADFSRGVTCPRAYDLYNREYYIMQGEQISAAGATIFGCFRDKYNQRHYNVLIHDYDVSGGVPGFKHSFIPTSYTQDTEPNKVDSDGVVKLGAGIRQLPFANASWVNVNTDYIDNYNKKYGGALTSRVSIYTTGAGNSARELRIVATVKNSNGNNIYGYWRSDIYSQQWQFKPANFAINNGPPKDIVYEFDYSLPNMIKNYSAVSIKNNTPNISMELINFNPFNPPNDSSIIKITSRSLDNYGRVILNTAEIYLYTVDAWNPDFYIEGDKLRGSFAGTLKSLKGTVQICNSPGLHHDPSLKAFVDKTFMQYDPWQTGDYRKTNCLRVLADDANVSINSEDGRLSVKCNRVVTSNEFRHSFYMKTALSNELQIYSSNLDLSCIGNLYDLKQKNEQALSYIKSIYSSTKTAQWKYFIINTGARSLLHTAKIAYEITDKLKIKISPHLHCLVDTAFKDAKLLLHAQGMVNKQAIIKSIFKNNDSYIEAIGILEQRILDVSMMIDANATRQVTTPALTIYRAVTCSVDNCNTIPHRAEVLTRYTHI